MARPRKTGMDYFPHDVFSSSDEKIEPLLMLYGSAGYAFYFLHLEYIYRTENFEFNISDEETRQILCQKLHINLEEYQKILDTCLKRGCFDAEYYKLTFCLTSNGIKKRAKLVTDKRDKMSETYDKTKQGKVSASETTQKHDKVKESKVKESKDIKRFIPPTVEQVSEYCLKRKNSIDPETFVHHYTSNGWKVGPNPMKEWKSAVITWEKKESKPFQQRQMTVRDATAIQNNELARILNEERNRKNGIDERDGEDGGVLLESEIPGSPTFFSSPRLLGC